MNHRRFFLILACLGGGLSVVLGAFAAHGLKNHLDPNLLNAFEVGVRYQMYHTLALLAVSLADSQLWTIRWTHRACWAWTLGILFFSGSLYLMAITGIRWLGAITPIGGVALIVGWFLLAIAVIKLRSE